MDNNCGRMQMSNKCLPEKPSKLEEVWLKDKKLVIEPVHL
jgi:hypothetical protein